MLLLLLVGGCWWLFVFLFWVLWSLIIGCRLSIVGCWLLVVVAVVRVGVAVVVVVAAAAVAACAFVICW